MIIRPRRLRRTRAIRDLACETHLSPSMLIYPIFVREGHGVVEELPSMPGQQRWSPDTLPRILERVAEGGVGGVLLFGVPGCKDEQGSGAWDDDGVVQRAMRVARRELPELTIIGDVCLCAHTSHGHCGVLRDGAVDDDATLDLLARAAVSQARAGADIVAPSSMMDGQVRAIRSALDGAGLEGTAIFSYAVKYASAFYGPFREAAGSAPSFGDRASYQMDPRNAREALREARLDVEEGADALIVKPGLPCLDVLRAVREDVLVPVGAYQVSGEYAMIKAAAMQGWLDEERAVSEAAVCLARAGASFVITYFALGLAERMRQGRL